MSGGHFGDVQSQVRGALEQVSCDNGVIRRFPALAEALGGLSMQLYEICREIDFDFSDDSRIEDDQVFELRAIGALLHAVLRVAPDNWFSRGKWATIQAFQERSGYTSQPDDI